MPPQQPFSLPKPLQRWVERLSAELLAVPGLPPFDFAQPAGEPALVAADSVSWRVFSNPLTLFIGGVAAVLLELGEPRVRHGVWDHSGFRVDPVMRLRRTGLAAMVTVYGPESRARAMIAAVNRLHAQVSGTTSDGIPYRADDPELLEWVQATASWGFVEAFAAHDTPLPPHERDLYYAEAAPAATLYGAAGAPRSEAQVAALFERMAPTLEPSETIAEFLIIMRRAPILPAAARPLQKLLVAAAIDLLPPHLGARLDLPGKPLRPWQRASVRALARLSGRVPLAGSPPVEASRRLGLLAGRLYRR
jgi:uncharacterized protein (DUF2236 family)